MHQDHDLLVLIVPVLPIASLAKLNKLETSIGARRHVAGLTRGELNDGPSFKFLHENLIGLAECASDLW
jgi:hypothetical protein